MTAASADSTARAAAPAWAQFVPKLATVLQRGYGLDDLRRDAMAGLTVAVVALPLAMALAIASGTTPEKGLHTAIVAGFLISALGGSRVQIGGPTAAFVPVVFHVITQFGYGGLILCTLLSGLILIAAGLLRLGNLMKFMPKPVVTGFTAGIAVSIFSSQIKDALGLPIEHVPADFLPRWQAYFGAMPQTSMATAACTVLAIALIVGLRKWRPAWPGFLIAVSLGAVVVTFFSVPVATIGSRFGEIPATLPVFDFPRIPFERTGELLPASLTIAFLAGVESLLSAVVADGMIAGRHRSNAELIAQGVANAASALFGGLPATGAIARTATNVRAGARTPVAGMVHAAFLLVFMLLLAPLMRYVPLPVLAAVLLVVAWNMAEIEHFKHLLRGPWGDRAVLLVTFVLTVVFDLTVAIEAGVVLAAFVFMQRMAAAVAVAPGGAIGEEEEGAQREPLPPGVEVFQINGPLFFAVSDRLDDVLDQYFQKPRVLILRLRLMPMIDASGAQALKQFLERAWRMNIRVVLSGLTAEPRAVLARMGVLAHPAIAADVSGFEAAVPRARELAEAPPA